MLCVLIYLRYFSEEQQNVTQANVFPFFVGKQRVQNAWMSQATLLLHEMFLGNFPLFVARRSGFGSLVLCLFDLFVAMSTRFNTQNAIGELKSRETLRG